jgi:integrase/recombinase XerD
MKVNVSVKAFREYLMGVKSPTTARKYAAYTTEFLRLMRSSGYQSFSQIPSGFLREFASSLRQEGKSSSTVRVHVFAVKKYLDWVRDKGVKVAHQSKVDLPKRDIRMRPVLPPDKFTLYFRQADLELEEPVRTAVMLLPCCGLRANEMVTLKLSHIFKARVKTRKKDKRGQTLYKNTLFLKVRGKGDKERHVPLMEEGVEILVGYLSGWRRTQPGPWLFPRAGRSKGKKHISDRFLRAGMQAMRDPLGMHLTPHTMRRTYITTLWRKGIDLGVIANIAGHESVQTTLNHYITMEPSDSINALHRVGSSLTEG